MAVDHLFSQMRMDGCRVSITRQRLKNKHQGLVLFQWNGSTNLRRLSGLNVTRFRNGGNASISAIMSPDLSQFGEQFGGTWRQICILGWKRSIMLMRARSWKDTNYRAERIKILNVWICWRSESHSLSEMPDCLCQCRDLGVIINRETAGILYRGYIWGFRGHALKRGRCLPPWHWAALSRFNTFTCEITSQLWYPRKSRRS